MKRNLLFIASLFFMMSSCANEKKDYVVTIHTSLGDMKVILFDETPLHKANFIELAESGQYDSTIFHRIIKEFMVQGGGIDMKNNDRRKKTVPAEIVSGLYHHKGALAAARQGDQVNPERASSWCQFYIVQGKPYSAKDIETYEAQMNKGAKNKKFGEVIKRPENADLLGAGQELQRELRSTKDREKAQKMKADLDSIMSIVMDQVDKEYEAKVLTEEQKELYTTVGGSPHLDNEYTVFGKVIEGLGVVDKLAAVKIGSGSKPAEDYYLTMEVEELSKKKITKLYGYEYNE
ncbi:MAG: peptidylprolyl isomerase [Reichenbachiella sp.]